MKKSLDQLKASLEELKTPGLGPRPDYADVTIQAEAFIKDNRLCVSAENPNSIYWADYYGSYRGGYPWINPLLEAWAKAQGGYWEWRDPGSIELSF